MKYAEALKYAELYLQSRDIADAAVDAWYLMEFCCGMDRTRYFLRKTEEMSREEEDRYRKLLHKRGRHIPLQHITGEQEFMGLSFLVNEHVLIPRQDTEILVEEALKRLKPGDEVLDMCTGSGCIIVSLMKLRDGLRGTASDVSPQALQVARENARRQGVSVQFTESDLFETIHGTFDLIVSNPPYIPTKTIDGLMPEVREHEPVTALDGKEDGLYFYRRIIGESEGYLRAGGWLLFEIGCDQGEAVSSMMRERQYTNVSVRKDLAGLDRVVLGRRGEMEE